MDRNLQHFDYDSYNSDSTILDGQSIQSNQSKLKNRKNFKCPYEGCQEAFVKNLRLQTHIRMNHTGFTPFQCPHENCSSSFACRSYLNRHLKRHLKSTAKISKSNRHREYKCPECSEKDSCPLEQIFRSKIQLKLHQAKKHGLLPFKCDKCDQGFIMKSKLNAHQRCHRGYRCSFESCPYQTDKWTELRKHLATEHRKLECTICLKTFMSAYNLRIHKETVHRDEVFGEKISKTNLFRCSVEGCDKSYNRVTSLNNHIRTFHCDPKHHCLKCDRRFRHKKSLLAHLDRVHFSNLHNRTKKPKLKKSVNHQKLTKSKLDKMLRIKLLIDEKQLDMNDRKIFDYCDQQWKHDSSLDRTTGNKIDNIIDVKEIFESNLMR